ncbi:MAG: dipeptide epimerase [Sulfobacillus thermotolerans]|nr:dipeptide epimerase [Sulfobacillus thermotolerans]
MRLIEGMVHVARLPLVTPFRTSLREVTAVDDVRVTLVADSGHQGLGSASPTAAITGETTAGIVAAIREYLLPALYGRDLDDRNATYQAVQDALQHNTSAKAAVDIALHDLYARFDDMPLVRQLGGKGTTVLTDATVSLDTTETMERQALSLVAQGFSQLKIKVGGRDGDDAVRVRRIREAVGGSVRLWIDPNQAWSVRETLSQAEALGPYGVEFIEQPLPASDMRGMAEVRSRSALPICADEAVYEPLDLQRLLDLRAADILNVKLMKAGGLTRGALLLAWAQAAGLHLMVGSMMEGPASVSAAAALAQAYQCHYVDLDAGYFLHEAKAQGGIRYEHGAIVFPDKPGLALTWQGQEEGLV